MINSTTLDLKELIVLDEVISVCDIGANPLDGEKPPYSELIECCGSLVAFEPHPEAYEALLKGNKKNCRFLPYAIGDGLHYTLNVCKASGMSSLLEPNIEVLSNFNLFKIFGEVIGTVPVKTIRLDDVSEIEEIHYLKMDVQGFELNILQNAPSSLHDIVVIHTEVCFVELYKGQPLFGDIDLMLRNNGFMMHCIPHLAKWPVSPLIIGGNPRKALNQVMYADIVYIRDFAQFQYLLPSVLKRLCMIMHSCYQSYDIAAKCIEELMKREVLGNSTLQDYRALCSKDVKLRRGVVC